MKSHEKLYSEMIEISCKKCYATNGKLKRMSLLHNNQLHGDIIFEERILIGSFLVI